MLSSSYMVEYDKYIDFSSKNLQQRNDIQFQEQSRVRGELTDFLTKIYDLIQPIVDENSAEYKNSPILKYIVKNGKKKFKYVRKISKWVGDKYYGSDDEINFVSLYYLQPIIAVIGVSYSKVFNIFDWNTYSINDESGNPVLFKEYIKKDNDEIGENGKQRVKEFLIQQNVQHQYETDLTSNFLLSHPTSYVLVGGMGHWTYAVNESLLKKEGAGAGEGAGAAVATSSGGNSSYNVRTTKKIKNKYYKKESSSSSSKTTKKHKKTRRMNKNKKRIKKTIKL
jgi:hypothetical protein